MATGDVDQVKLISGMLTANFNQIRFADQKAQFLLRIALALFVAAFIGVPPSVMALKTFWDSGGWKAILFATVILLYVVCSGCLVMSIMQVVSVIRPRIAPPDESGASLFFDSVAQMEKETFRSAFRNLDHAKAVDELLSQFYETSRIASHKYARLGKAICWMLSGGLVGVMFSLILLISYGLVWNS